MTKTELDPKEMAHILYQEVIRTADYFLHNCKGFSVEILALENPSYAELALIMKRLPDIIRTFADDFDPMLGQKAHDYCDLMHRIGVAISASDQIGLVALIHELERRPRL